MNDKHKPGFFTGLRKSRNDGYDLWKLVDERTMTKASQGAFDFQFICDIDKTYLETEFESLVKIARIAFIEGPEDKITVEGASDVLLAARWGNMNEAWSSQSSYPRPLHFVSSSPPQLRKTMEDKLFLDGLDWSSDTFKNQIYNIKKGRFDLLRQQIAYKSAAILKILQGCREHERFILIGDNAESDSYIYVGLKLLVEGFLSLDSYCHYLRIFGVEEETLEGLLSEVKQAPRTKIEAILIRDLPRYQIVSCPPLSEVVLPFRNFYEASVQLIGLKVIDCSCLWDLTRKFHNRYNKPLKEIVSVLKTCLSWELDQVVADSVREVLSKIIATSSTPIDTSASDDIAITSPFKSSLEMDLSHVSEERILEQAKIWYQSAHDNK